MVLLLTDCSTWQSDVDANVTSIDMVIHHGPCTDDCQCMTPIAPLADCSAPCGMLASFVNETDQDAGCTTPGMHQPSAEQIGWARTRFATAFGDADPPSAPVFCLLDQLVGGPASSVAIQSGCVSTHSDYDGLTCEDASAGGWCLEKSAAACATSIGFGAEVPPEGVAFLLTCDVIAP